MTFDEDHSEFIKFHQEKRRGERLRRLKAGHGHAEKLFLQQVWWPAFGQFNHLHPEYEVYDFKDGHRYLDFAYIRPYFRVAFEIDGYGPHGRDLSRWQFSDQCQRQNHLRLAHPITPQDVCTHLKIENKYARKLLHSLVMKKWLQPASGQVRIRSYQPDLEGKKFYSLDGRWD
ncbi:DNA-binding response regulator [Effusibacillus consociatus]|uniref:DNA-binding response regulator n=1 Tax=Effusibacillus consociatus TaxID=1117041 RepID=A0ABV9Q663_9BACL